MILKMIEDVVARHCPTRSINAEQIQAIVNEVAQLTGSKPADFKVETFSTRNRDDFETDLGKFVVERYEHYRQRQNQEIIQER